MRKIERNGETILVEMTENNVDVVLAVFHKHDIIITSFKVNNNERNITEIEFLIIRSQHVPQLISELSLIESVRHVEF